ncbi:MAG TPA: peptidylprolyl isomerase [Polyangiaceae bacterium]|nr:peptidylprolyl isomerase [Polyangiaceae bacterium]
MQIANEKVITIDYTLTDEAGEVLDSSSDDGPLSYLHGFGNIVPGLEAALEGKAKGDSVQVTVAPEEGYGKRDEALVQSLPRNRFPDGEIEVGMQFHAEAQGASRVLTVVAVDEKAVTIDANHPLAGRTLSFDVTVRDVRDATAEELEHGHVHDGDDHHHDHDHHH